MKFKDKAAVGEVSQGGTAETDPEATGTFDRSKMLDLAPGAPANDSPTSSAMAAASAVVLTEDPPLDDIEEWSLGLANPPLGGWVLQGPRQRLLLWRLCWRRN